MMRARGAILYQGKEACVMDVSVAELWLPIVLSAVGVFIVSFIAHMLVGHHNSDFTKLPNEDGFLETVRSGSIAAGQYMFPFCDMKDMKDPEKKKRYAAGPHGVITVWPGVPNMGKNLVLTFIYYLVVGLFVAYLGSVVLHAGEEYMRVFRVAGTAAVMAYCLGSIPGTIWFGQSWRCQVLYLIDGVVYGLVTAGVFGWLWPAAEAPSLGL
jgi:FtsH-binding integral membrane protein